MPSELVKAHMRKALANDRPKVEEQFWMGARCPTEQRGGRCQSQFTHTDIVSPGEPQRQRRLQLEQLDKLEAKYA